MDRNSSGSKQGDEEEEKKIKEKLKQIQNQKTERTNKASASDFQAKSCKGYLYYSSNLKSNGSNPRCIGIPRSFPQAPNYVGHSKLEAEASQDGRTLSDFYYGCAGYSLHGKKEHSADKKLAKTELPICVGLELLVDRRVAAADSAAADSAPAHVHHKEDGRELSQTRHELPQPGAQKPGHSAGEDFLNRYTRNASLVASGVARNMRKVGNYIKESVDDVLYPYRRRPK